jgi:hypothetical protein
VKPPKLETTAEWTDKPPINTTKKTENAGIRIYRGILTGCNEAFIIDEKKRDELIKQDPKSAEIINPILRGKNIQRYGYEFGDEYLISTFPSLNIKIDEYQAVKKHLLNFGKERLEQSGKKGARKKTNNKWFETQDTIAYWEDFYSQVICWQRITKKNQFCLTQKGFMILDSMAFLSRIETSKFWLLAILNSELVYAWMKWNVHEYGDTGFRLSNQYVENIPVPKFNVTIEKQFANLISKENYQEIDRIVYEIYGLSDEEIKFISLLLK